MSHTKTVTTGFTLGTVVAVALSWSANNSILWAIVHGFLSCYTWFTTLLRRREYVKDERGGRRCYSGKSPLTANGVTGY